MQNDDNIHSDDKEDALDLAEAENTNISTNENESYIPPDIQSIQQGKLPDDSSEEAKPAINRIEENDYQTHEYDGPQDYEIDPTYSKKVYKLAVNYDFYQSAKEYLKELANEGMNYIFFGFNDYMKNYNRTKRMVGDTRDDLIQTLSECSEKEINYAPFSDKQKMDLIIMKREHELECLKAEREQSNELDREQ